jgi:methyltransferase
MVALIVLALAFLPMALEARLAAVHDRALRSQGAVEPQDDVFPVMQVAYPASFLAMALEFALRGARMDGLFAAGTAVFVLAKAIKYWAIGTLGPRWTFRVLVPPGSSLIRHGPYRFLRHPNYVGVIGELAGMAILAHALFTGPVSVAVFAVLIVMRIRVEERALAGATLPVDRRQ